MMQKHGVGEVLAVDEKTVEPSQTSLTVQASKQIIEEEDED